MFIYTHDKIKIHTPFCANIYRPPQTVHGHDYFEVAFCTKNKCIQVINGVSVDFSCGVCTIIRPSDMHWFKNIPKCALGDYQHKDVYIPISKMKKLCDSISPSLYVDIVNEKQPITFNLPASLLTFINKQADLLILSNTELQQMNDTIHSALIITILSQWIEERYYSESHQEIPEWLKKLLVLLSSLEYMTLPISQIAQNIGYTKEHLSREFHKHMHITLNKYIMQKNGICSYDHRHSERY